MLISISLNDIINIHFLTTCFDFLSLRLEMIFRLKYDL